MCSPVAPLSLDRLGLDQLGLLASHPRVSREVREAFGRALHAWVQARVRRLLGRHATDADRDDVAAAFLLRCYTRHLRAWRSTRCALSSYLYARLRCEVVDHQRLTIRRARAAVDVDAIEIAVAARDPEVAAAERAREARLQLVDDVVDALPRRQKMVLRRSLNGETVLEISKDTRMSRATAQREKNQGMAAIQRALALAA